ncbi:tetratricopeptide repeat protein [Actinomadura logoneensis]|uniref:Tetratricopeptide repeat protein n=1 Tax=Actinomadura logoneensis TaxID=2293572 RepID=A0A372JNT9_9ACTN|nr:tetratricopeptide repeat protein [Actinomadura logoneensis]RFU41414.1 tetratricopeptide repeat protein [Actinomadura logoneensis]
MNTYEEFQRAQMFFEARDYISAARLLAPVAEAEPGNGAVAELLARAYFHSAQLGRAEDAFRRLIEIDPCNGWAHEALARTLERRNRREEAARYRKLAVAMGVTPSEEIAVSVTAANLAD